MRGACTMAVLFRLLDKADVLISCKNTELYIRSKVGSNICVLE